MQLRRGSLPWQLVVLVVWDVAAATVLLRVWFHVGRMDGATTQLHATREDDSRTGAGLLLITAGTVSLVGVGFCVPRRRRARPRRWG